MGWDVKVMHLLKYVKSIISEKGLLLLISFAMVYLAHLFGKNMWENWKEKERYRTLISAISEMDGVNL